MLPELIYREEKSESYVILVLLGLLSVFLGFAAAKILFPSQSDLLAVVFAAMPGIYPLLRFFLDDEKNGAPHLPEILSYGSIFLGQVIGFTILGLHFPDFFTIQAQTAGITGYATNPVGFGSILENNLVVFGVILGVSTFIGSAGSFILSWNASVMGVFFASLVSSFRESGSFFSCVPNPSPICYLPHATFEIAGFITAGILGSLISASIYRRHFDLNTWKNYGLLLLLGLLLIVLAAFIETA